MNPHPSEHASAELLAQVGWVRALARELLPADPLLAEDVVQETVLAALRRPPDGERSVSGWLATVLRNFVRQSRRGDLRRKAREVDVARSEALPSTLDLVEKLSAHRAVVEAVSGLEEPYRTTVLLRYFEELSPPEIARAQGIPLATVKTRLARALDRLRERLDREHGGDGRSWFLALIPLTRNPGAAGAVTWGTLLVTTKAKIVGAVAAVLVVCGAALWLAGSRSEARAPVAADSVALLQPERAPEAPPAGALPIPAETRVPVDTPERPLAAAAVAEPAPLPPVRGRVLDLDMLPVAGVHLWLHHGVSLASSREITIQDVEPDPDAPRATSDRAGRFEFPPQSAPGRVLASDPYLSTVLAARCGPGLAAHESIVVVAPRLEYSGRVREENGRPLADVRLVVLLPENLRARFSEVLDSSGERGWIARSDSRGYFVLPDVPRVDGAVLQARLEGWLVHTEDAPLASTGELDIVLRRPPDSAGSVSGQVLDPHGRPAAGALVSLGPSTATADEEGTFTLRVPEGGTSARWMAVKPGYQPAIESPSAALQAGRAEAGEFVLLRLGPPPLSIEGRVVDSRGEPMSGVKVWLADPTFFGLFDEVPAHVEGMLAGAASRSDLEKLLAGLDEKADPELTLAETPSVFWNFVRTGADGRFELTGLVERDYRLAAMDAASLLRTEAGPIPAGRRGVELVLDTSRCWERVAGTVVSASGEPVPGVKVLSMAEVMSIQIDANSESGLQVQGRATRTDERGRFELRMIPKERVYLELDGESILPLEYGRNAEGIRGASGDDVQELVIHVALRRHLKVELDPDQAALADHVCVLDASGERLRLHVFAGNTTTEGDALELHDGRSDVMVVSEEARTLVLLHGDAEVRRVPVHLGSAEVNVVRP
jgi:RNA polymerase sigma-70 factor (ECF subfamily)